MGHVWHDMSMMLKNPEYLPYSAGTTRQPIQNRKQRASSKLKQWAKTARRTGSHWMIRCLWAPSAILAGSECKFSSLPFFLPSCPAAGRSGVHQLKSTLVTHPPLGENCSILKSLIFQDKLDVYLIINLFVYVHVLSWWLTEIYVAEQPDTSARNQQGRIHNLVSQLNYCDTLLQCILQSVSSLDPGAERPNTSRFRGHPSKTKKNFHDAFSISGGFGRCSYCSTEGGGR